MSLDLINQFSSVFVVIDFIIIIILALSMYFGWRIIKIFPRDSSMKKYWYILMLLMLIFISLLLANIFAVAVNNTEMLFIIGIIFYLLSSVFILFVTYISFKAYTLLFS